MNGIGRVSELFFIGKAFCKQLVKQWGQESRCKYLPTLSQEQLCLSFIHLNLHVSKIISLRQRKQLPKVFTESFSMYEKSISLYNEHFVTMSNMIYRCMQNIITRILTLNMS